MKNKEIQVGSMVTAIDCSGCATVIDGEICHPGEVGGWIPNRAPWRVEVFGEGFPSFNPRDEMKFDNDVMLKHPVTGQICWTKEKYLKLYKGLVLDRERMEECQAKWDTILEHLVAIRDQLGKACYLCEVFDNKYVKRRGYFNETPCPLLDKCGFCQDFAESWYRKLSDDLRRSENTARDIVADIALRNKL